MPAESRWQTVFFPHKIHRARNAVVGAIDEAFFLIFRREFFIDIRHFLHHFFPTVHIGEVLGQVADFVILAAVGIQSKRLQPFCRAFLRPGPEGPWEPVTMSETSISGISTGRGQRHSFRSRKFSIITAPPANRTGYIPDR